MEYLWFLAVAGIRVTQSLCSKKASLVINNQKTLYRYGTIYFLFAGLAALVFMLFTGFPEMDFPTLICSFLTALFFAIDMYTSNEKLKGGTIVLSNLFSSGGLIIYCIIATFMFSESMGLWQWIGLLIFIVSAYFLVKGSENAYTKISMYTFIMLVLSLIVNGGVLVMQKYFALKVPNGDTLPKVSLYSCLTFFMTSAIMFIFSLFIKGANDTAQKEFIPKPLYLYGICLALSVFALNQIVTGLSSQINGVVLFTLTTVITLVSTSLVGAIAFKEKLTAINVVGVLLGFVSVIIIKLL